MVNVWANCPHDGAGQVGGSPENAIAAYWPHATALNALMQFEQCVHTVQPALGELQPSAGPCVTTPAHGSLEGPFPSAQEAVNVHPEIVPFSNPPLVAQLIAQVLHTIGVGDMVLVIVGEPVRVGLIVHVAVIVLVRHGVQVRDSVGGQVMEGVGESGTAQQIESST